MHIRPAQPADLPHIVAIYEAGALCERELLADPLPPCYAEALAEIQANPRQALLVAEEAGAILGTLQITFVRNLIGQGLRCGIVEAVFVHPDHRGRGVGKRLMARAEEMARAAGCRTLELTSNKARAGAHAFYEGLGFHATHEGFKRELLGKEGTPGSDR